MHIYAHKKILRHINAEGFLLIELTGSWAHAGGARETHCISRHSRRNRLARAHRKRRRRSAAFHGSHLKIDRARKPCPYSESMNPRRRSLTVVSFSSA